MVKTVAKAIGYPLMLKAAHGGGGRGMRVVKRENDLEEALSTSQRESFSAFGSNDIFIEKLISNA